MVAGFSVKEWSSIAQIMALTWLLGLDGFFHVLEQLLVEMSVDISRLKLLLSGDVEQNPGPMQVLMLSYYIYQFFKLLDVMLLKHICTPK